MPTEVPTPTATPTPLGELTTLGEHGFRLVLIGNIDVQQQGLTGTDPDASQGQANFAYGGADVFLLWLPAADLSAADLLAGTFASLQQGQSDIDFTATNEGAISAGGQDGVFGGFTASASGEVVGGGLIGSWRCPSTDTIFSLTVTGEDSTTVQVRFDELTSSFECAQ